MFIWEQQSHFLQVEHLLLRGIRTDKTKKEILRKKEEKSRHANGGFIRVETNS